MQGLDLFLKQTASDRPSSPLSSSHENSSSSKQLPVIIISCFPLVNMFEMQKYIGYWKQLKNIFVIVLVHTLVACLKLCLEKILKKHRNFLTAEPNAVTCLAVVLRTINLSPYFTFLFDESMKQVTQNVQLDTDICFWNIGKGKMEALFLIYNF